jgi:hypothetical protein
VPAGCAHAATRSNPLQPRVHLNRGLLGEAAEHSRCPTSSLTRLLVVGSFLRNLVSGGVHVLNWFAHEFLLLVIRPPAGSGLARLCRLVGCLVIAVSLRAELREGMLRPLQRFCSETLPRSLLLTYARVA